MIVLSALFVLAISVGWSKASCPSGYPTNHTMCLTDKGVDIPMTDSDKQAVVDRHNEIRAGVSPPAANMQKMVWNDDLAAVAAKWSRQCTVGHDSYDARAEPSLPGVIIGQNSAGGYSSILAATNGWYSEVNYWTYGYTSSEDVGHYTQIVFAETALIGCGEADCSSVAGALPKVQICNYATGQNGFYAYTQPYVSSDTACSGCGTCDDSGALCDCNGKVCLNGGTLDLATCGCTCPTLYSGDQCETELCPDTPCVNGDIDVSNCNCGCDYGYEGDSCDTKKCGTDTEWKCNYYFKHYSNPCRAINVQREDCPERCGWCD